MSLEHRLEIQKNRATIRLGTRRFSRIEKKLFLESKEFTRWLQAHLDDVSYAAFQFRLMSNPDSGDVIRGCGGLRKIRLSEPRHRKGKRSGNRVIYLHVPEANWIFLLAGYAKKEKDDLSESEKKVLRRLAEAFKREALASVSRLKDA